MAKLDLLTLSPPAPFFIISLSVPASCSPQCCFFHSALLCTLILHGSLSGVLFKITLNVDLKATKKVFM